MEEHDTPDPEFIKGFNEGYTLAKHLPELSQQLDKAEISGARGDGLRAGKQQLALEQEQQRQPAWLRADFKKQTHDISAPSKPRDPDLDMAR